MERRVRGMETDLQEVKESLNRMVSDMAASNSKNVNTVRIEGAGSVWHGLAIGIALGAVIIGGAWIISTQQRLEMSAKQAEAYAAAIYMVAPRLAEEIDKELDRKKEVK